jgi:Secretion system C-terminal sorting domain
MKRAITLYVTSILILSVNSLCKAQTIKILFDATKAEMAGNADWLIDADTHNLGPNANGVMVTGQGNESNPARYPTPAQSGITATTPETYWKGSLSNWGIDLVKKGYAVETLPNSDSITYGNASHLQDLSNYKVFIVDEPNILFSASQRNALIHFVQNGGGLFIISDHDMSDRNNDGYDSPHIWNDLFANNSVQANPFGITFDYQNFSETSTNIANLPSDSCLHGVMGNVTEIVYNNGTSITLDSTANSSVKGLIYKTGASNTGTTQVLFARALFGNGKVCALGDSSPPDDGTGDTNDVLYNGYTAEANGSHQKLLVDATIWLIENNVTTNIYSNNIQENVTLNVFPNPSDGNITVQFDFKKSMEAELEISDLSGRIIVRKEKRNFNSGIHNQDIIIASKGFYFVKTITSEGVFTKRVVVD